ncbi:hypothetical protein IWX46DRAFT_205782 [Phyllosticta citricarpa]|uniref:Uncharacterized protein n=1 Tax=Phyllosticta citricarpa TaxID=55181 RepID=A0ABR1LVN5_9PEZI
MDTVQILKKLCTYLGLRKKLFEAFFRHSLSIQSGKIVACMRTYSTLSWSRSNFPSGCIRFVRRRIRVVGRAHRPDLGVSIAEIENERDRIVEKGHKSGTIGSAQRPMWGPARGAPMSTTLPFTDRVTARALAWALSSPIKFLRRIIFPPTCSTIACSRQDHPSTSGPPFCQTRNSSQALYLATSYSAAKSVGDDERVELLPDVFRGRRSLWRPQLGAREWKMKEALWIRQWRIIVGRRGKTL